MKDRKQRVRYKGKKEYIQPSAVKRKQKSDAVRKQQYHSYLEAKRDNGYVWMAMTKNGAR